MQNSRVKSNPSKNNMFQHVIGLFCIIPRRCILSKLILENKWSLTSIRAEPFIPWLVIVSRMRVDFAHLVYRTLLSHLSTGRSTLAFYQFPFISPFQPHSSSTPRTLQAMWASGLLPMVLFHLEDFSWLLWPH